MSGTISDELRNMFTRIDTLGNATVSGNAAAFPPAGPRGPAHGASSRITNSVFMQPDHQVHRLKTAAGSQSIIAASKDGGSKVVITAAAGGQAAKPKPAQQPSKTKPWLLIAIVVVLVLMVAAVVGILFFRRNNKRKQEAEAKRMQLEAQRAQEEEAARIAAEIAAKEKEDQEMQAARARQAAAKDEIARQAAQALRRQQAEKTAAASQEGPAVQAKAATIPMSVYIPSLPQQREASVSSRVQVLDEQTQKPVAMATARASDSHLKSLDATVKTGIDTLREGVKQSILSQRMHDTEPQRDASVLLSRPVQAGTSAGDARTASAVDANSALDAVTKPLQNPANATVVGSTASAAAAGSRPAEDVADDSSAIPSV